MTDNAFMLTDMELDALRETMNISFGSAAADLADIMDIFIQLTVPSISSVDVSHLPDFVNREITDFSTSSVVQQKYDGDFEGMAFLIFPYGNEKELISYFQDSDADTFKSDQLIDLEKEVLLEISNILIGACIGRIFEMLNSRISYQPPQILSGTDFDESFVSSELVGNDLAITMNTFFSFEDRNTKGYLILINSQNSIPHLKKALAKFIGE
ncbi:MAG: chemotaxis protein CheC [Spirochaetales bacterium]|nr:chemotaxis protein CheC [Spirochaetales bacterium]